MGSCTLGWGEHPCGLPSRMLGVYRTDEVRFFPVRGRLFSEACDLAHMGTNSSPATSPDPRFPIGKFTMPEGGITRENLHDWICEIEHLPARLRQAVAGLNDQQLDTPYRHGGWTVRQVVHHFADSHLNAYTRLRLALTEENPIIKPYDEAAWANLPDAKSERVDVSLSILTGLHARWAALLNALKPEDWNRTFRHPEYPEGSAPLDRMTGLYAWHCRHHVAHISVLRTRNSW